MLFPLFFPGRGYSSDAVVAIKFFRKNTFDFVFKTDFPLFFPGTMFFERHGDLFSTESPSICQCVSVDCKLGKGIAKELKEKYPELKQLKPFQGRVGSVLVCKAHKVIFNLCTKQRYWQKPTISSLHATLVALEKIAREMNIFDIAAPAIGTGLDRLDYGDVRRAIKSVFDHSPVNITIYLL